MEPLIKKVTPEVEKRMNKYDASHDYTHIQRVLTFAKEIEAREDSSDSSFHYNSDIITLGCLLHDVGDHKYLQPGEDGETMVEELLLGFNVDVALASKVQAIVNHVSYSKEVKDHAKVLAFLSQHRDLAVVQDADRLESIGAYGIARFFIFHANMGHTLDQSITYFAERLENLERLMKTRTGREMAAERTQRAKIYRGWFEEEAKLGMAFLSQHRDSAVVQDADRLESIGAHGIAGFFILHAKKGDTLDRAMTHFAEELENLERLMETRTGREMAAIGTQRAKIYRSWFEEEASWFEEEAKLRN